MQCFWRRTCSKPPYIFGSFVVSKQCCVKNPPKHTYKKDNLNIFVALSPESHHIHTNVNSRSHHQSITEHIPPTHKLVHYESNALSTVYLTGSIVIITIDTIVCTVVLCQAINSFMTSFPAIVAFIFYKAFQNFGLCLYHHLCTNFCFHYCYSCPSKG